MARKRQDNRYPPTEIETTVEGQRYRGMYQIEKGGIRVTLSAGGSKWAHLGGMSTDTLARLLLGELVVEERRRS